MEATDSLPLLTAAEARALGCLIEKEATTPDVYPLTIAAALVGCQPEDRARAADGAGNRRGQPCAAPVGVDRAGQAGVFLARGTL